MTRDYRDACIEELALAEAELLDRVADLVADRDAHCQVARAAIHRLHELTRCYERLRAQYSRLLAEYRRLRAQVMRQAQVA